MYDNMIGELAAMRHEDRQREMAHEALIAEALRPQGPRAAINRRQRQRAAIASALRALAIRLAPPQEEPTAAMRHSAGAQP
jgi:hypothetical protein